MSQHPQPVRQAGFILYTDDPAPFRLCRAERIEYRLVLTCVDAQVRSSGHARPWYARNRPHVAP